MHLVIHTDGGARGNPGPAAVGVVIELDHKTIVAFGKKIGIATNNVAEYQGVIEALCEVKSEKLKVKSKEKNIVSIIFYLDSSLVVNQLNGVYKIKNSHLKTLHQKVKELEHEVGGAIHYVAIPREQNMYADRLVNQALDTVV